MGDNAAPYLRPTEITREKERKKSRKRERTPEQEARMATLRARWAAMEDRALHIEGAKLVEPPAPKEAASSLTLRP